MPNLPLNIGPKMTCKCPDSSFNWKPSMMAESEALGNKLVEEELRIPPTANAYIGTHPGGICERGLGTQATGVCAGGANFGASAGDVICDQQNLLFLRCLPEFLASRFVRLLEVCSRREREEEAGNGEFRIC